jgi:hypothetical protein
VGINETESEEKTEGQEDGSKGTSQKKQGTMRKDACMKREQFPIGGWSNTGKIGTRDLITR